MARLTRVVVPEVPHHVMQRGNGRLTTFFGEDDYRAYLDLLGEWCGRWRVAVWAYCLMPNHVHLMLAVRYVKLNPVRAKLCRAPWRWRWSSAAAHVAARNDGLVDVVPMLKRVDDWREYLVTISKGPVWPIVICRNLLKGATDGQTKT